MILRNALTQKQYVSRLGKTAGKGFFPPVSDRKAWEKLKKGVFTKERCVLLLKAAEKLKKKAEKEKLFPEPSFAELLAFQKEGSRVASEAPYFQTRQQFITLLLAECLEHKGRFTDLVCEGLWAILSEPFWYVAAHAGFDRENATFPLHQERPDLFSCQTGMTLAMAFEIFGEEFDRIAPPLRDWAKDLIETRVISPVEKMTDWWIHRTTNWNPWCCFNTAGAARFALRDDPERLAKLLAKLCDSCQTFYDFYQADGGCDEGPNYYAHAGLMLFDFVHQLNLATDGAFENVYREKKFKKIMEFFTAAHLCGPWMASFSDSHARQETFCRGRMYRAAECVQSEVMRDLVLNLEEKLPDDPEKLPVENALFKTLADLFFVPEKKKAGSAKRPLFTALPDLQFFILRENSNENKGKILTFKGGHNAQTHNHNDVGEFELFCDGMPVIADTGSKTYTKFTFSGRRYEDWAYNALGHNPVIVNGICQEAGKEYAASLVKAEAGSVVLDLSKAYPKEAKVRTYLREACLTENECSITDALLVSGKKLDVSIHLYTPVKPVRKKGFIQLGKIRLYADNLPKAEIREIPCDDPVYRNTWKELYRITLSGTFPGKGVWKLRFE